MARIGVLIGLLALPGCGSLLSEGSADVAGIAGAAAATSVTRSAAAAAAIGLGVRSLAAEGVKYTARRVHRTEQDAIAATAGPLDPGTVAAWQVNHSLPLEPDAAGQVVVSRAFGAGALQGNRVFRGPCDPQRDRAQLLHGDRVQGRRGLALGLGRAGRCALGRTAMTALAR